MLSVVVFIVEFFMTIFSAIDKKYEFKAFEMVNGLLDSLLSTFIVNILLLEIHNRVSSCMKDCKT